MFSRGSVLFLSRSGTFSQNSRRSFGRAVAYTVGGVLVGAATAFATVQYRNQSTEEGGSFSTFSSSAEVAHCRSRLDTPEYLIPYYLRSNISRFTYYASKKENGSRFKRMNEEEFLQALLGQDKNKEVQNTKAASDLFKQFDTNADGEISFKEFSFMLALLATPRESFITAFQMFNRSANAATAASIAASNPLKASLNFEEFCDFIETRSDEHSRPKIRNSLMKKLFGETGNSRCTAEAMLKEVDLFKKKVWRAEFLQHVDEKEAEEAKSDDDLFVPTVAIGSLMYDHLVGRHLPFSMVKNIRKLKAYDASEDSEKISLHSWYTFSRLMESTDRIAAAVRLYAYTTKKELNRTQFARAVRSCNDPDLKLTDQELDLLFVLFDTDGSGTISFDEFEKIAESRRTFHIKSKIEEKGDQREFFVPRLMKCTSEAVFSE